MALKHIKDSLPSINRERQAELLTKAYAVCASAKDKASGIDVPQVALQAKDWVVKHPIKTGCYVTSGVIIVVPGLVAAPALGVAGFTAEGIAGGSAAAAFQSTAGPAVAHGVFATLQSAGAAGYGVPIIHGAIQGAVGAGLGISALWNKWRKGGVAEDSSEVGDREEKKAKMEDLKPKL